MASGIWTRAVENRGRRLGGTASAIALVAVIGAAAPALAQQEAPPATARTERRIDLDIPAQDLNSALLAFGDKAGVQLFYDASRVKGLHSNGARGEFTIGDALMHILAGTGLTHRLTGPNAVALEKLPQSSDASSDLIQLGPVRVEGQTGSGYPADPYAGVPNPPTTVGGKTPLTQREVPQSVTVITQEQIQQQNMQTLNDAMLYTPGVTVYSSDSERTNFYSRGFPITSWMFDGLPTTQNQVSTAPNLAMFDRVEVLRGPDGLMNGFGAEGGAVNLVRKRAPDTFQVKAEALAGTYADFGGTLDVGGPLNGAGSVRARVVGNLQSQDLMWDTSYRHDKFIYGTLEADLTPNTLLRLGASYSDRDQRATWNGIPAYITPINGTYGVYPVSRSTYLGTPWNKNSYYDTTAFAELDQKLGSDWTGKLAFNYLGSRSHILNDTTEYGVDNTTNLLQDSARTWHESDDQETVDAFVNGPVRLFGRTHQLTIGASYQHELSLFDEPECGPAESSSGDTLCDSADTLSELQNARQPAFNGPFVHYEVPTTQYGLYANTRINLADPLTLVAGVRATWWDYKYLRSGLTYFPSDISGKLTPYGGLIYDLDETYSAYVSYTGIFKPQNAYDYQRKVIPPLEGEQYEAGIKGEYFGGKLNTSLALFQLTEDNRALTDPHHLNYSVAQGRARSRGIELTATGQLTPDWTIDAGYTYTDAEYLDPSANSDGVGFSSIAPKHLFKLWTNYRLPGDLNKFSIGGGMYVSSSTWATDGAGGYLRQGGYATFDLQGAYQITDDMSLSAHVTNLFDRHYLSTVTVYNVFYGNPRQILFTLRYAM